ncbi:hypothetical protein HYH03_005006 [Edaphochlamys debaryana]|uniref:MYND-type domain-containing protein n=1 Tax=Edaphochlamys debaryana TaxID=47281 RepID=A0A835YA21_9CHLO|nr:hypothetical protein HYH03_005006 [Edaphochlamys debaryana]|eukprot:KAG2497001.1 hypothetical protein HYH03_005006 [Edaphochlamys debaryana]
MDAAAAPAWPPPPCARAWPPAGPHPPHPRQPQPQPSVWPAEGWAQQPPHSAPQHVWATERAWPHRRAFAAASTAQPQLPPWQPAGPLPAWPHPAEPLTTSLSPGGYPLAAATAAAAEPWRSVPTAPGAPDRGSCRSPPPLPHATGGSWAHPSPAGPWPPHPRSPAPWPSHTSPSAADPWPSTPPREQSGAEAAAAAAAAAASAAAAILDAWGWGPEPPAGHGAASGGGGSGKGPATAAEVAAVTLPSHEAAASVGRQPSAFEAAAAAAAVAIAAAEAHCPARVTRPPPPSPPAPAAAAAAALPPAVDPGLMLLIATAGPHTPVFAGSNPSLPNACAACGTAHTSSNWRRGWALPAAGAAAAAGACEDGGGGGSWGLGRCANLCNRCGVRYKRLLSLQGGSGGGGGGGEGDGATPTAAPAAAVDACPRDAINPWPAPPPALRPAGSLPSPPEAPPSPAAAAAAAAFSSAAAVRTPPRFTGPRTPRRRPSQRRLRPLPPPHLMPLKRAAGGDAGAAASAMSAAAAGEATEAAERAETTAVSAEVAAPSAAAVAATGTAGTKVRGKSRGAADVTAEYGAGWAEAVEGLFLLWRGRGGGAGAQQGPKRRRPWEGDEVCAEGSTGAEGAGARVADGTPMGALLKAAAAQRRAAGGWEQDALKTLADLLDESPLLWEAEEATEASYGVVELGLRVSDKLEAALKGNAKADCAELDAILADNAVGLAVEVLEKALVPTPEPKATDSSAGAVTMAMPLAAFGVDGASWASWLLLRTGMNVLGAALAALQVNALYGAREKAVWSQLAAQLASERTLTAVAGAARFVHERLWPQAKPEDYACAAQPASATDEDSESPGEGDCAEQGPERGTGQPQHTQYVRKRNIQTFTQALTPREVVGLSGPLNQGIFLLTDVNQVVRGFLGCLHHPIKERRRPTSAASGAAAAPAARQMAEKLVAGFRRTGVLEQLFAALLAAPLPHLPLPPDAERLTSYSQRLLLMQSWVVELPSLMHEELEAWVDSAAVTKLLLQPQALRFRAAALQQLALWRPEATAAAAAGSSDAAEVVGSTGQEAAGAAAASTSGSVAPGAGSSSAGAARPAAVAAAESPGAAVLQWPLLQQRALRLCMGPKLQITEILEQLAQCAAAGAKTTVFGPGPDGASQGDPLGLALLLPDLPAAAATLGGAAQALGNRAEALAALGVPKEGNRHLQEAITWVTCLSAARLQDAKPAALSACLPDIMHLQGWLLRAVSSPVVLPGCIDHQPEVVLIAGMKYWDHSFTTGNTPVPAHDVWGCLSAADRAAAQLALQRSGWAPAFDRIVRWRAQLGPLEGSFANVVTTACLYLLPVTLGPSVRQWWDGELQRRQEQGASGGGGGAGGAGAGDATGGGGGRGEGSGKGALRPWPAQEALGALVTLAKLARREAARLEDAAAAEAASSSSGASSGTPELFAGNDSYAYKVATALLAVQTASDAGWAALAALAPAADGGADAAEAAEALAESRRRLAEVVDFCGVVAIRLATLIVQEATAALRARSQQRAAARGGSARGDAAGPHVPPADQVLVHARLLARLVTSFACRCSPAALAAAEPQRALAAMDALMVGLNADGGLGSSSSSDQVNLTTELTNALFVLAGDEKLRHLAPGWYWASSQSSNAVPISYWVIGSLSLNAAGIANSNGAAAPSAVPLPAAPVVRTATAAAAALAWASWPRDCERVAPLLMKIARQSAMERNLFGPEGRRQWAVAVRSGSRAGSSGGSGSAGTGAELQLECSWPPQCLRVCGNPRCGVLAAGAEAELGLKQCGGCRAVRYCCSECQRQHWRGGHKAECGQGRTG